MRQMLKTIVWNSSVRRFLNRCLFGNSRKIHGTGNTIHVGKSLLTNTSILIEGNDNRVCIGDDIRMFHAQIVIRGNGCQIHLSGFGYFSGKLLCADIGSTIAIGSGVTAEDASIAAYEGTSIHIANDCALGAGVDIHSSDAHAIYDTASGKRLNPAQSVDIQRHVWLAQGVTILKGATIGEGAIIGAKSLVSHATPIPSFAMAVGIPARPICSNIRWTRERAGTC
jgi:acetyltransferase-like isoleucine patch superfamily enzyme